MRKFDEHSNGNGGGILVFYFSWKYHCKHPSLAFFFLTHIWMFSCSRVLYICIKINGESFAHDKLIVKVVLSKNYGPIQISKGEISK